MAHKLKTASNGTIFCSKCGGKTGLYDECNEKGHSFTIQKDIIFCTKCGIRASYGEYPIRPGIECSDKGHKYKVFPNGEIRCTKCGRDHYSSDRSCSN